MTIATNPGIDHPVIAVRDLADARTAFERLGFVVPPLGRHLEWGTGNLCIMFPRDYLELRGILDPHKYTHGLDRFLAERQGLMGVAFATGDAHATHRGLVERGFHPQDVRQLTRNFELPTGAVQLRFSLCFPPADETPGLMSVVFCQHQTPELIRQPRWLVHPNGATSVAALTSVVPDPEAATRAALRLLGEVPTTKEEGATTLLLEHGGQRQELRFASADWVRTTFPQARDRAFCPLSGLAAISLRVADINRTAALLTERDISYLRSPTGSVCPIPSAACDTVLEFVGSPLS